MDTQKQFSWKWMKILNWMMSKNLYRNSGNSSELNLFSAPKKTSYCSRKKITDLNSYGPYEWKRNGSYCWETPSGSKPSPEALIYVLLGHNTIRGAAGASILNAELIAEIM
jgi:hypothetical protein